MNESKARRIAELEELTKTQAAALDTLLKKHVRLEQRIADAPHWAMCHANDFTAHLHYGMKEPGECNCWKSK